MSNLIAESLAMRGSPQGRVSPQPRVFQLVASLSGGSVLLYNGEPQNWAGSTVMYDPTSAAFVGTLEVAFDAKSESGAEFFALQPGVVYRFTPGQFNWLYLRFTPRYTDSVAGITRIGKLVISPTMAGNQAGSSPQQAIYTRPVPRVLATGTRLNADRNASSGNWATVAGGTGIFTNRVVVATLGSSSGDTGIRIRIRNTGPTSVFVATSSALADGTLTSVTGQTYELPSGEADTFELVPTENTPDSPAGGTVQSLSVYSADANAAITFYEEAQR